MLIGERIELRLPIIADAAQLAAWGNDPDYLGPYFNHWPRSVETMTERLSALKDPDHGLYLIVERASGEMMGMAGFSDPHAPAYRGSFSDLEVWYQVLPRFRGQGIATQAACLLVNQLFSARPLPRLTGYVVEGNAASVRVLEKAGLRHEGTMRRILFLHGEWVDMRTYGILREEWGSERSYRETRRF